MTNGTVTTTQNFRTFQVIDAWQLTNRLQAFMVITIFGHLQQSACNRMFNCFPPISNRMHNHIYPLLKCNSKHALEEQLMIAEKMRICVGILYFGVQHSSSVASTLCRYGIWYKYSPGVLIRNWWQTGLSCHLIAVGNDCIHNKSVQPWKFKKTNLSKWISHEIVK